VQQQGQQRQPQQQQRSSSRWHKGRRVRLPDTTMHNNSKAYVVGRYEQGVWGVAACSHGSEVRGMGPEKLQLSCFKGGATVIPRGTPLCECTACHGTLPLGCKMAPTSAPPARLSHGSARGRSSPRSAPPG
jgi:hypothetical protein